MNDDMSGDQRIVVASPEDVAAEIDLLLWARLRQRTRRVPEARVPDSGPRRTESVATVGDVSDVEHCWSVADTVSVLAPEFPYLHHDHAVELAFVMGRTEIAADGDHPQATKGYLSRLGHFARRVHATLLSELAECLSPEARFVTAVDAIQELVSLLLTDEGGRDGDQLSAAATKADRVAHQFPPLRDHARELLRRIVRQAEEAGATASTEPVPAARTEPRAERSDVRSDPPASVRGDGIPPKPHRLRSALDEVARRPGAQTGLEGYRQISDAINRVEDEQWGTGHWHPPRYVSPGVRTDRLYPIAPESIYPVPEFPGVDLLVSVRECVFISRWGAIEVQRKEHDDLFGQRTHFRDRRDHVIFAKPDWSGDGVWHAKNRR